MKYRLVALASFACFVLGTAVAAEPVLMSAEWAKQACEAWNADSTLTEGLEKWIENDKGRGFKVIEMYRTDCPDSPRVELRFNKKDSKAMCGYGGAVETKNLDVGADGRVRAVQGDDVRPLEVRRPKDGGDGQHGAFRGLPAHRGQGSERFLPLPLA